MEYIKKEELKDGEIYYVSTTYGFWMIGLVTKSNNGDNSCDSFRGNATYIDKEEEELIKDSSWCYEAFDRTYRLATLEEKHWLETCIKVDKFITFEEAMKTFVTEYYEYINNEDTSWKLGKIYKLNENKKLNFESGKECTFGDYYTSANLFKPSTKEAYDAQFVVKEPKFVLPEKWCLKITKENLDFCKSLENNELKFHKNYPYSIGGYYSPIPNKDCNGFINIPKNYTEITFEQFKKYVLKEEIVEEKVIEPLPQFKVIETIETITKVENNEGNQFFIGDVVISSNGTIQTIESFDYNKAKTNIIAFTNKQSILGNGIGIDKIEHYIEPKVEVEDDFILPEKWCIKRDFENDKIVTDYINKIASISHNYLLNNSYNPYLHNKTSGCCSYYKVIEDYTEITFDQFKKHVLKEEVKGEIDN